MFGFLCAVFADARLFFVFMVVSFRGSKPGGYAQRVSHRYS
jgi:hypothetical protein